MFDNNADELASIEAEQGELRLEIEGTCAKIVLEDDEFDFEREKADINIKAAGIVVRETKRQVGELHADEITATLEAQMVDKINVGNIVNQLVMKWATGYSQDVVDEWGAELARIQQGIVGEEEESAKFAGDAL